MNLDALGFEIFRRRRAIGALALGALLVVLGSNAVGRLRARLPDPINANRHIEVLTEKIAPPVGTPLVCMRPRLRVVGVVEAELRDARTPVPTDRVVRVSIYPEALDLIRDDARFTLRVTSPDLLEIFATHFTPERRAALAARLERWYRAHEQALHAALARIQTLAAEHLGVDELGTQLRADPLLRDAIGNALEAKVIDAIDWEQVVRDFLDSPAGEETGRLLGEARLVPLLWSGIREGYAARVRRALGRVQPRALETNEPETPTANAVQKQEDERALGDWLVDSVLGFVAPDNYAFEQAALDRAKRDIEAAYPKHEAELGERFSELGLDLVERHRLEDKLLAAGKQIAEDEALHAAILERYGPEAWKRVERFAAAVASDEELTRLLRTAADRALELLVELLHEITLDETGTGPNPLVIGFLRARLLGRTAPLLVLEAPGHGAPVAEGERFEARTR